MIVDVSWHSTYEYSGVVRQLHNELRVVPASAHGQRLLSSSLATDPAAKLLTLKDAFGNTLQHFDLVGPVTRLEVQMEALVDTADRTLPEPALPPLLRHLYLQPTERCPFDPRIAAVAAPAAPDGAGPIELAEGLLSLCAERFRYETGKTDVQSTALDLLLSGRGVCQDFAHFVAASLRMAGFPARYVSGYLAPASGVVFQEASHAWIQVYVDGAWHGFDPANHAPQDARYVVTAVGRDYADVPPVRGSFRGSGKHEWRASVRIASQDDPERSGQVP